MSIRIDLRLQDLHLSQSQCSAIGNLKYAICSKIQQSHAELFGYHSQYRGNHWNTCDLRVACEVGHEVAQQNLPQHVYQHMCKSVAKTEQFGHTSTSLLSLIASVDGLRSLPFSFIGHITKTWMWTVRAFSSSSTDAACQSSQHCLFMQHIDLNTAVSCLNNILHLPFQNLLRLFRHG